MSNRYHIKTSESNVSKFKEMVIEFTKIDFFYPKNFFNFDLDKLVFESWESPKFIISSNSKYLIKGLTQTKNMKIIFKLSKYSIDVHLYDKFGETLDVNDMWCPPLDE
jgi:hypothetical protein